MQARKALQILFLLLLLSLGGGIVYYYWTTDSFSSIRNVPKYLMFLALGYVIVQILKRTIFKQNNWWDWLYYLGLASMMIPTFFAAEPSLNFFRILTDFGTLFLLVPIFFDGKKIITG